MRYQDKQRSLRRFLEYLKQGIGRGGVQIVYGIDNANPPTLFAGGLCKECPCPARFGGANFLFQPLCFCIELTLYDEKIAVAARGNTS